MLYASQDGNTLIVAAADELIEFEEFLKATADVDPAEVNASRMAQADFMTMLTDKRLDGIKRPPLMITFNAEEPLTAFVAQYGISLIKLYPLVGKSKEMITAFQSTQEEKDDRSIAEIYGFEDEEDGEALEDDDTRKKMQKAQQKGHISGDSFGPGKKKKKKADDPASNTHVTDVHVHKDADGNLVIDSVLGVKGLHETDEGEGTYAERTKADVTTDSKTYAQGIAAQKAREAEELSETEKFRAEMAAKEEFDHEDLAIDPHGIVAIFHKVEVTGAKLADIRPVLAAADFDIEKSVRKQNNALGCWFAFLRQLQAEEAAKALTDAGFVVECYGVNDRGERLAPKGVTVVDELAAGEVHPRPWNFRASELSKMTDEERAANKKTLTGKEFLMVGRYYGADRGTILHIVPRVYFKETGNLWEQPLDIANILPQDFEELAPGVYRSKSRDWNHISFDMASRGFAESIALQLKLNHL